MALNTIKCNDLTTLHFKGLTKHSVVSNMYRTASVLHDTSSTSYLNLDWTRLAFNRGRPPSSVLFSYSCISRFCSSDLDSDLMTFTQEPELDNLKKYLHTKNEVSRWRLTKVRAQTRQQTDRQTWPVHYHSQISSGNLWRIWCRPITNCNSNEPNAFGRSTLSTYTAQHIKSWPKYIK